MASVATAKESHIVLASLFGQITLPAIHSYRAKQKRYPTTVQPITHNSQPKTKESSKFLSKEELEKFQTLLAKRSTVSSAMALTYTMVQRWAQIKSTTKHTIFLHIDSFLKIQETEGL
jgi:hypothetical protein